MSGAAPNLPRFKFTDSAGAPLANGSLTVYLAGTTTATNTWQDSGLTTLNTNPITLDANGEALIWLDPDVTYKWLLKDADGATVSGWPVDNIRGSVGAADIAGIQASVDAFEASSGSSLIGYMPTGTGATATNVQAKLREYVSVKDFGATGDGVTDDTADIQAAINANRNGEIVWFPDGTYLTSGIIVYSDCHLAFSPGAVLKMSANGVCVKTRNLTTQTYVTNAVSRVRIDNLEINMDGKLGFGLLLEGATHAHIEKPRVYNVGNGTFSYNDGVATDTYSSAGIALKGVFGVQGCYYNRVQRAQVVGTSTSGGSNGIYMGTTASGDDQRANYNAIIQPVCSTLENGVSINMGGDNYIEMPEVSACGTGIRVGRSSGSVASRRNHIKMPYVELCTTGLALTSNALDTVIDGIGSTSGTATPIDDSGTNTAFFAANSGTYTTGFARLYKRELRTCEKITFPSSSGTSTVATIAAPSNLLQLTNDNSAGFELVSGATSGGTINAALRPLADNVQRVGTATFRVSEFFAGNGTINTSDEREKSDIEAIPGAWLDAWGDVQFCRYRWTEAVAQKGDAARWHVGLIAQRVKDAFEGRGLDPFAIGLLCYDEWDAEMDADGNITAPAGNRYGIRYEQALALECALQRRVTVSLEARLAALEAA
jgi:hypothetical protein